MDSAAQKTDRARAGFPANDLQAKRREASEQSKGASEESIYTAIEYRLADLGASGEAMDFGAGTGELTRRLHRSGRFRSIAGADLYPAFGSCRNKVEDADQAGLSAVERLGDIEGVSEERFGVAEITVVDFC